MPTAGRSNTPDFEAGFDFSGLVSGDATADAYAQVRRVIERETAIPTRGHATSDADGRFVITPLRPGPYRIQAASPGALGIYTYLIDNVATPAALGDDDVTIVLQSGSDITGRIVDAAGSPLAEVSVSIATSPGTLSFATPMTIRTKAGNFLLKDVPPGRVVVAISGAGFARKLIELAIPAGGAPLQLGNVLVDIGAATVGKVVDTHGAPVAGATVWVTRTHAFYREVLAQRLDQRVFKDGDQIAQTNAHGEFLLRGIPADQAAAYVVVAQHQRAGISTPVPWSATPMTISLADPGAIEGVWRLKGQLANNQSLDVGRLHEGKISVPYSTYSDQAGRFRFPVLPPGVYKFPNGQTCVVKAGETTTVSLATTSAD